MRFVEMPGVELLYQETKIVLHVDNRYRGDILKQIRKIDELGKDYTIEVKRKRKDAEAPAQGYIWQMISSLAEKQNCAPIPLYRKYVTDHAPHSIVYYQTMAEALRSKEEWEDKGIGYMFLSMTDYKEYVKCERVRGYSGWNYNETDMFIRMLEKECNSLGINVEDKNARLDKAT